MVQYRLLKETAPPPKKKCQFVFLSGHHTNGNLLRHGLGSFTNVKREKGSGLRWGRGAHRCRALSLGEECLRRGMKWGWGGGGGGGSSRCIGGGKESGSRLVCYFLSRHTKCIVLRPHRVTVYILKVC